MIIGIEESQNGEIKITLEPNETSTQVTEIDLLDITTDTT